jgi:hypothetical protein
MQQRRQKTKENIGGNQIIAEARHSRIKQGQENAKRIK